MLKSTSKSKGDLPPLRFRAPGACKIKREMNLGHGPWIDLHIDQGREYEFFPCSSRPGYSGYLPGEWVFVGVGIEYASSRVLAGEVPRIHAELVDLMGAKPPQRGVCEICGSRDRVESGPWICDVYVDLNITDANLCFNCANYEPVGVTGPKVRDARLTSKESAKRSKQAKKVAKLKEFGFLAMVEKPVTIGFARLGVTYVIKPGDFVEFRRTDNGTGWQIHNVPKHDSRWRLDIVTMTDPACILWMHKELRRIRRLTREAEALTQVKAVTKLKTEQQNRFKYIFDELED